ncbi:hypothetical protein G6R30_03475 [Fructobacillus sp. S1-1]|uniref:Mobilization protein n=1 Tax=Fructobacillus parabroussonetiae TaxID=2713174 RepID=A0ABS5QWD8_9LACO|nr:hypothetical protein [Fructobacillus parabroussonetiae]
MHLRGDENDKHIHIHLGIFEEESSRPTWTSKFGNRSQPKGVFKQKSLNHLKKSFLSNIELEQSQVIEKQFLVSRQLAEKKLIEKMGELTEQSVLKKQQALLNAIIEVLPDSKKDWRANSNAVSMKSANALANDFVENLLTLDTETLETSHHLQEINRKLRSIYKRSYGENAKTLNYVESQKELIKKRLINELYRSIKKIPEDGYDLKLFGSSLDEHQAIKKQLEEQVNEMGRKQQPVPKKVKRELGRQKFFIKKLNAQSEVNSLNENIELLARFNTLFSNFYKWTKNSI